MYRLSPEARARNHRLHVHDVLGSTNSEALALARAGESGPLWVVAQRQSGGRGRRGNAWVSPEGNLAASLLLPIAGIEPEQVATLGFVAGAALVQALDDALATFPTMSSTPEPSHPPSLPATAKQSSQRDDAGAARAAGLLRSARNDGDENGRGEGTSTPFRLKWPNDVLADGRKIAGILLEAEGRRAVVIGFGVNVAGAPEGLPYPATALAALGCTADAANLFAALTARFVETLAIWNKGRGFSVVRQRWLERAAGLGAPVSVRLAGATLSGRHDGIDEGGRLVILAPDGTTHTVTAGEVHFGEAATAA